MRINYFFSNNRAQAGVSLIELIVFLVVVAVASTALFSAYTYSALHNVDPIIETRALELAQAKLDEILALKYDENTPTGGIPACSATGSPTTCNNTTDANMNDVDDYNGYSDTPYANYSRSVTVTTNNNQKLITVSVSAPKGVTINLAAYKANF